MKSVLSILFVTDNRFWRREIGSQQRIASLVDHFTDLGHDVTVLFTGYLFTPDLETLRTQPPYSLETRGAAQIPATEQSKLPGSAVARTLFRYFKQLRLECHRHFHQRRPYPRRRLSLQVREPKLLDHVSEVTIDRFKTICTRKQPDVVILEYVRLAYLFDVDRAVLPAHCLRVIDTHDVQHERQTRFHANNVIHDIDITPDEEAEALSLADLILAIQPTDADKLRQLVPDRDVLVVGFPPCFSTPSFSIREPIHIGFFGSNMLPNRRAAERLVNEIFTPLHLTADGFNAELHIFGNVCQELSGLSPHPQIHLHGFVENIEAAYERLDIIANPVDFGGGLKIKNVEALSHGKPLVTTTVGAEGIESGAGTAFLVGEDSSSFRSHLSQLVKDPTSRTKLAQSAFQYAITHFSETRIYEELDARIQATARRPISS